MIHCIHCDSTTLEVSKSPDWVYFQETPAYCTACGGITWIKIVEDHGGKVLDEDQIPPFELGFKVKVIDEHSCLYGKEGYVIDKDHVHYRVKVDHHLMWVPEHWVERVLHSI